MQCHKIQQGQRLQCLLVPGSSLRVQSGKLQIQSAPQFLEGVAWQVDTLLCAGMSYQPQHHGWVDVQALEASELLIQQTEAAGWLQKLSRAWRSVWVFA
ncbi:hypothetical protein H8L32_25860 [Undibacterium sp. CY18W]|uniref:Uncharacterized protein n=1 Tax=Undibacterium hunanense TaxID=2762292 RepID=A0ABR6ZYH7_9BURK|nr:hypothetical protein [Undibacterium hunanense]MBC3920917.1 hypothetical protein [Undibacterium hunanense]